MEKQTAEKILHAAQVEAVLLTDPSNMRFVAGFTGEGYVYLSEKQCLVVTDSRYTIAASAECVGCLVADWGKEGGLYIPLYQAMKEDAIAAIGVEDTYMTMAEADKIRSGLKKAGLEPAALVPLKRSVTGLRAVKCEEEIARIKKAEAIGDRAFQKILAKLHAGMTEKQVAAYLEFYMKEEGAEGFSFETIAASGLHSAMPHAVPTDKVLREGDFLTMDFGCRYQGYCSDMTRTVVIGRADEKQRNVYETVRQAQQAALDGIRPGMTGKEIDALARDVIRDAGYGEYFGHALGHSVGLDIHEQPVFSQKETAVIRPGMVITVEPGIYIKDFGGVRIEDVVVITEDGCENITHSPKNLIEI